MTSEARPRSPLLGPLALAVIARVFGLAVGSAHAPEGDESSYLGAAFALVQDGVQDGFWPPLTGWLLAALSLVLGDDYRVLRAAYALLDLVNVVQVHALTRTMAGAHPRADVAAKLAASAYALYLPAIGFACSATSELPTLLLLLTALRVLSIERASAAAGWLLGLATLARANLVLVPWALALPLARAPSGRRAAALLVLTSLAPPLLWAARNVAKGEDHLFSANASYNLYLGNGATYQEDLDLFSPRATQAQIAARRGGDRADVAAAEAMSPSERSRAARAAIVGDPLRFARRALGRLARIFAPRTAHLALVGGERAGRKAVYGLLGLGLVQWALVLFPSLVGIACLRRSNPRSFAVVLGTVVGSILLGLVAIAKPRYGYPFEPLLIGAAALVYAGVATPSDLDRRARALVGVAGAFLAWGWAAWLVFAFTSRA